MGIKAITQVDNPPQNYKAAYIRIRKAPIGQTLKVELDTSSKPRNFALACLNWCRRNHIKVTTKIDGQSVYVTRLEG